MKSGFKFFTLLAAFMALGWIGCQTQVPTSYLSTNGASPSLIANFDVNPSNWPTPYATTVPSNQPSSGPITDVTGKPVTVYPVNNNLAEPDKTNNLVSNPGQISVISAGATMMLVAPGANNTSDCAWVSGTVTDLGNLAYPTNGLQLPIESTGYYNGGLFTGIKFYIKIMPDDTALVRSFAIPVAQTIPVTATGGSCTAGSKCYDNFSYSLSSTGGNWQLMTVPFLSMTRASWGNNITPSTLSGINLEQILPMTWTEGNNNVAGIANIDFYVDEINFY